MSVFAISLNLNLAVCCHRQENCSLFLQFDSGNVKALYKRALVLVKLSKFGETLVDLVNAADKDPGNREGEGENLVEASSKSPKEEVDDSSDLLMDNKRKGICGAFRESVDSSLAKCPSFEGDGETSKVDPKDSVSTGVDQ